MSRVRSEVQFYATRSAFPTVGVNTQIYVAQDTGIIYVWVGWAYVSTEADLTNVQTITFDTTYTGTPAEGKMYWNSDDGTVNLGMPGGNVNLQLWQENIFRAKNVEGGNITNGYAVRITSAASSRPEVVLVNSSEEVSLSTIAVATETVTTNQSWYFTTFGMVRWMNTSGLTEWETVYLGTTDGSYTLTKPSAPNQVVIIGTCVRESATEWVLFVHVSTKEIERDRDLTKEPTGFNDPTAVTITENGNRTITLTGTFNAYYKGVRNTTLVTGYTSSAHTNDTSKTYFLTYNGTDLAWRDLSVYTDFFKDLLVCYAFYDTSRSVWVYLNEPHGLMQWQSHKEFHQTTGTYRISGWSLTAGTYTENTATDAAITPGFDAAVIADEDIQTTIWAWTQGTYTSMRIAASSVATFVATESFPFRYTTSGYINYNNATTGAEVQWATGKFYNVYQILIPTTQGTVSQLYRMVMLQPQAEHNTLAAALAEDFRSLSLWTLTTLSPEFVVYARITYSSNASHGTTGKVVIATGGVTYLTGTRANQVSVSGFVATSHTALSNLVWTASGHTGSNLGSPVFNSTGVATEVVPTASQGVRVNSGGTAYEAFTPAELSTTAESGSLLSLVSFAAAPSSPTAGDTWIEVSSGKTYLKYYNGSLTLAVELT